jgi:hypothetical protein
MLDEGLYSSITEMAESERLDRGYKGRLLQLALLAPKIMEAVLHERQSVQLAVPALMNSLPVHWEQQSRKPEGTKSRQLACEGTPLGGMRRGNESGSSPSLDQPFMASRARLAARNSSADIGRP